MVIRVRTPEGRKIFVPIPNVLISPAVAGLGLRLAEKHSGESIPISKEQLSRLLSELRRYRRHHPDWVLVEAQSADGSEVCIKM